MSTATITRPSRSPGDAGVAVPARAVRPLPAPGPLALGRRVPEHPASRGRTRLTRRGRLVLLVLAVALLLAGISVGRARSQASTAAETGPQLTQTTVQQGDTLWTIARRIGPDNDPRQVIAQIRRINHLESSSLRVGQQLLLPAPAR